MKPLLFNDLHSIKEENMKVEDIILYVITGFLGFFLFYEGITSWKEKLSCKEKISGRFVETSVNHSFGTTKTRLIFEYQYAGKNIRVGALDNLSNRRSKKFVPGENYPIYINPAHPKTMRCTKKIMDVNDTFLVFFGGFMFFGTILVILRNFFLYFG